jgi:hypothetical protein
MVNYYVFQYKVHNAKLKIPRYNLWELCIERRSCLLTYSDLSRQDSVSKEVCVIVMMSYHIWKVVSNNRGFTVSLKKINGKQL